MGMGKNQKRKPKGTPQGGQFATSVLGEQPPVESLVVSQRQPGQDDYEVAASDAVTMAGLSGIDVTEFDAYRETIGFEGAIDIADIDIEMAPDDLAPLIRDVIDDQGANGALKFASWHPRSTDIVDRLWSTELSDDERAIVLDHLDLDNPDEFNAAILQYWENGDPKGADRDFGLVNLTKEWKRIGNGVAAACPSAKARLDLAKGLSDAVASNWASECEYLGSDEWAAAQDELDEDF